MHRPNPRQERPHHDYTQPIVTRTTNISPFSLPCILAKGPCPSLGSPHTTPKLPIPAIVHLILRQKSPINIQQPFLDS
ncbi:hypothetical protein I7I50_09956 [Histoplasma capsulatum G186AR]|uniref:Uncharacterized protein n=1 Tax=Ajellomyces capsulatus TaxID=5037 RepID=A0A8H7Z2Y2_AJECA|nr:hypothetical protein I7I52_01194 [Histoplasma capsulatum]QSS68848.1 hypothetical protein I7I50_09956 [Histoplasma capsulatum G186AR]